MGTGSFGLLSIFGYEPTAVQAEGSLYAGTKNAKNVIVSKLDVLDNFSCATVFLCSSMALVIRR